MLKYYKLPSIQGEGWAHLTINTETGFFATVSDWGSYAFIWTDPGIEFRAFLTQLQPDYLYGKLMMGRPNIKEFDEEATRKEIKEGLDAYNESYKERHNGLEWASYERELDLLQDVSDEASFVDWQEETSIDEPYSYRCVRPCHDCTGFCTNVWPRFVALLEAELEEERKLGFDLEVLKAARPSINAAFKADMDAMMDKELDAAIAVAKKMGPDRNG